MRTAITFILFAAACSHPLHHAPTVETSLPFLSIGMSKEQIIQLISEPEIVEQSSFGREVWTFPATQLQTTYSNSADAGWYLFRSKEAPLSRLVLQFDSEGFIESVHSEPLNSVVVWEN